VLPAARDRGIAVLVNRPFAEGALVRRLRSRALPAWAGELGCRSWPQLLLKFVIAHPAVTCVIPATSSVEHLRDNMAAGSGPMPDEAMRERIASAVSGQ
jgi:aryl-alcohol dehydrogenase-like predicted oxidoreductase